MICAAKSRAKREGYDFDLIEEEIFIPEICPILLIPLFFSDGKPGDNTPALDRVDNTKGYVTGNVRVISHKANKQKADFTVDQIHRLWKYVSGQESSHPTPGITGTSVQRYHSAFTDALDLPQA